MTPRGRWRALVLAAVLAAASCSAPTGLEQVRANVELIGRDWTNYLDADERLTASERAVRVGLLRDTLRLLDRMEGKP